MTNKTDNIVSVVIPCYNDKGVVDVVREVVKAEDVGEVIVVDDGSSFSVSKLISGIEKVRAIRHKTNLGKTAAVKTGIIKTKSKTVMLLDADLTGLKTACVERMIHLFMSGNLDLLIGVIEQDVFFSKWLGFGAAYSGQRVVRRNLLFENKELFLKQGFLLEPIMNKYLFGKFQVKITELIGVGHILKLHEQGLIGLAKDIKMWLHYLIYLGPREMWKQMRLAKSLLDK